ncbi:MAG: thiamine-phosphate kinase [Burkholderiaceae bacterium]|jgi:thiamine-monophosphate kinase|nr:thiamine-phosphate kinase [Burkholderiaceae bacterium]
MGEFELIERVFARRAAAVPPRAGIALGIGDDCALLAAPPPETQLAVSTDMLVEGRHFFPEVAPNALGHKALAVNLSDLAAMGAEPLAFTLALALPPERARDADWLDAFADGLMALAQAYRCALIGGDTTAGPLAISITVFGYLPRGQALRRDGARAGDDLWVSGALGDARLALEALRNRIVLSPAQQAQARQRLERPTPRIALGQALRGVASSCIDLSDGLAGDLGHVLHASDVGARINADVVASLLQTPAPVTAQQRYAYTLAGGDDYELIFTAPPNRRAQVETAARQAATPVTRIGGITAMPGLALHDAAGRALAGSFAGFDHFA